jgi:hypothetical protein
MTVGVESDNYRGVPKHFGNDLGVDVAGEELGSAGVPEVVEAGMGWKTGTFEESGESSGF